MIPAVSGLLASSRTSIALLVGWGFGFLASVLGLLLSVSLDLPAASSIVVTLSALLVVQGGVQMVLGRRAAV